MFVQESINIMGLSSMMFLRQNSAWQSSSLSRLFMLTTADNNMARLGHETWPSTQKSSYLLAIGCFMTNFRENVICLCHKKLSIPRMTLWFIFSTTMAALLMYWRCIKMHFTPGHFSEARNGIFGSQGKDIRSGLWTKLQASVLWPRPTSLVATVRQ